ncbi:MAG TPA: hypothetical protein VLA56_06675 [Pseudomonadales bacterium]|nr:hypothetical protein [Pseudomonadales bacterium]
MNDRRSLELSVPRRENGKLSFCDDSLAGIEQWASAVSMSDSEAAAETLLAAIEELNRLEMASGRRFHAMETLRPLVHFVCSAIAGNRSRSGRARDGEQGRRQARLAQTLQVELATGYKIVIAEGLRTGTDFHAGTTRTSAGGRIIVAIHRNISELSHALLRCLQQYTPAPRRLWAQLHQLYYLAESKGVDDATVRDPENQLRERTSITDAYARALMLGSARANTLRPHMLGTLFNVLEDWSSLVRLVPDVSYHGGTVVVDLTSDEPPKTYALYQSHDDEDLRCLDASALLTPLNNYLADDASDVGARPALLEATNDDLVRHAVRAWGAVTKRAYKRMPVDGSVAVCAGMRALHAQITMDRDRRRSRRALQDDPALFSLRLVDASPGGYGMTFEGEGPEDLQTGELLGVREPGSSEWHVAVLRWFWNGADGARLGIELLAPRAEAAEARVLTTRGSHSDWAEALVLPEVSALSQPPLLITPRGPFRVAQKLALRRDGEEARVRLQAARPLTDSFQMFELKELAGAGGLPVTGIEVDYIDAGDDELEQFDF